jgi:hypothetical protein
MARDFCAGDVCEEESQSFVRSRITHLTAERVHVAPIAKVVSDARRRR